MARRKRYYSWVYVDPASVDKFVEGLGEASASPLPTDTDLKLYSVTVEREVKRFERKTIIVSAKNDIDLKQVAKEAVRHDYFWDKQKAKSWELYTEDCFDVRVVDYDEVTK